MTEIRCPMCGKANPAGKENCQYCNASLIQLGATSQGPTDQSAQDDLNWLRDLRSDSDQTPDNPGQEDGAGIIEEPVYGLEQGTENWLDHLQNESAGKTVTQETPKEWDDSTGVGQEKGIEDEDDEKDWLKKFAPLEPTQSGWLEETGSEQGSQGLSMGEGGNDQSQVVGGKESVPGGELEAESPEPPDWLRNLQIETPVDEDAEKIVPGHSGGFDGINRIQEESTGEPDIPDWLRGVSRDESLDTPSNGSENGKLIEDSPDDSISSWGGETAFPGAKIDLPDFFDDGKQLPGTGDKPDEKNQDEVDWLNSFGKEDPSSTWETPPPAAGAMPFLAEDIPDWLSEYRTQLGEDHTEKIFLPADTNQTPFEEGSFSGWLSEESEDTEKVHGDQPEPQSGSPGITEGQLPSWLQAMRPIDGTPAQDILSDASIVEKTGPLAGFHAILPTDNLSTYYRKPPVYSSKLRLTEKHQKQTELFENMLTEGARIPLVEPTRKKRYSQRIIRLIVGLGLILVVGLIYLVTPPGMLVLGLVPGDGVESFSTEIEKLSPDSLVLLAVDYEPGFSGEMDMVANPVIQRLIEKGARLAIISSTPGGVVLGENLVHQAYNELKNLDAQRVSGYVPDEKIVHLGYLAGQTVSLVEFGVHPMQAVRFGLYGLRDKKQVWDYDALKGNLSLADFQAVIVVVDTIDAGRAWIEQVQTGLDGKPFLVVSSAQAAPWLMPYYDSAQIQGIISGLQDGLFYGQKWLMPGNRAGVWGAFQSGMILTIVLILIGALTQGIGSIFSKRKSGGRFESDDVSH